MTSSIVDQVKASHDSQVALIVTLETQVTAAVSLLNTLKADLTAAIAGAQSIGPADAAVLQSIIDAANAENAGIAASSQAVADAIAVDQP